MISKEFIDSQKKLIENKIDFLSGELSKNKTYKDLGSTDEDRAKEFEDFEEKTALGKGENQEVANLKRALDRINAGTYGKCKVDGEPIEVGRLKAFPEAEYCASHAKTNK